MATKTKRKAVKEERLEKLPSIEEALEGWFTLPSLPSSTAVLSDKEMVVEKEIVTLEDLEETSRKIEEAVIAKVERTYRELVKEKMKLEEELKRLLEEKENALTVVILRDRHDLSKKIGKVVFPAEYRGIIVLFSDQKMVCDVPTKVAVTVTRYAIRTSRNGRKYIKAFKIYDEERENKLVDDIRKIEEKIRKLKREYKKAKMLKIFIRNNVDFDEVMSVLRKLYDDEKHDEPYSSRSFVNFLNMLQNMDSEKVDMLKDYILENYNDYIWFIYHGGKPYGVNECNYIYTTKFLVVPLPLPLLDWDKEKRIEKIEEYLRKRIVFDEWREELEKYLREHGVFDDIRRIGEIIDAYGYCCIGGECRFIAIVIKTHKSLPPEQIARINQEIIKTAYKATSIKDIVNKLQELLRST